MAIRGRAAPVARLSFASLRLALLAPLLSECVRLRSAGGPPELPVGSTVRVKGLIKQIELNGDTGQVEVFNATSGRYSVWIQKHKIVARIHSANLELVHATQNTSAEGWAILSNGKTAHKGMKVVLSGLAHSRTLNGAVATVEGFDVEHGRYLVRVNKVLKRVRPSNMMPAGPSYLERGSGSGTDGGIEIGDADDAEAVVREAEAEEREAEGEPAATTPMAAAPAKPATPAGTTTAVPVAVTQRPPLQTAMHQPVESHGGAASGAPSVAKRVTTAHAAAEASPLTWNVGDMVKLVGLKSSKGSSLNGETVVIQGYDKTSRRYVVKMPSGGVKRVKGQHLAPLTAPTAKVPTHELAAAAAVPKSAPTAPAPLSAAAASPQPAAPTSQPQVAFHVGQSVRARDKEGEEWKKGRVTSVDPELRVRPNMWKDDFKFKTVEAVAEAPPQPQLSVCNAYTGQQPIQVLAVSTDSSNKYSQVVHDLDFQSCADVQSLPFRPGALSVVVGKLEVARVNLNSTDLMDAHHGLELTVFRSDANSLKAAVHKNEMQTGSGDDGAYYLHLVDAYAGSRLLELKAKRGSFERKLPLGATYRLKKEEPIQLTLTDGFQKLKLSFEPRKGHTYDVAATGADAGLKGEARNVGLLAHEVGAWTAAEQMPDEPPAQASPAVLQAPLPTTTRDTPPRILEAVELPPVARPTQGPVPVAAREEAPLPQEPELSEPPAAEEEASATPLGWISDEAHRLWR